MKKFSLEEIPWEVQWVWIVRQHPVGKQTYDKIHEIIKKYPEHFPWETKYNSIPEHVHEAFHRETYPEKFEPIKFNDETGSKGIMEQMESASCSSMKPFTQKDLEEFFETMERIDKEKTENERKEHARVKIIWDKHYSPYNLEYRY